EAGFRVQALATIGGAPYRFAAGIVSIIHLAYRRLRGQPSWTWADVEADADSFPLRIYRSVFPALLAVARVRARNGGMRGATLMVCSTAVSASGAGPPSAAGRQS